jgi:hypothetical protein
VGDNRTGAHRQLGVDAAKAESDHGPQVANHQ